MTPANKLGWAVLGLCCVGLVIYLHHRGLYISKHIGLDYRNECNDGKCTEVPGYKLSCKYWTTSGIVTESGSSVYSTYEEAVDHGDCPMFRN
jgi:hypothetical protein